MATPNSRPRAHVDRRLLAVAAVLFALSFVLPLLPYLRLPIVILFVVEGVIYLAARRKAKLDGPLVRTTD